MDTLRTTGTPAKGGSGHPSSDTGKVAIVSGSPNIRYLDVTKRIPSTEAKHVQRRLASNFILPKTRTLGASSGVMVSPRVGLAELPPSRQSFPLPSHPAGFIYILSWQTKNRKRLLPEHLQRQRFPQSSLLNRWQQRLFSFWVPMHRKVTPAEQPDGISIFAGRAGGRDSGFSTHGIEHS